MILNAFPCQGSSLPRGECPLLPLHTDCSTVCSPEIKLHIGPARVTGSRSSWISQQGRLYQHPPRGPASPKNSLLPRDPGTVPTSPPFLMVQFCLLDRTWRSPFSGSTCFWVVLTFHLVTPVVSPQGRLCRADCHCSNSEWGASEWGSGVDARVQGSEY